jgi:hypothetical protein
MVAMVSVGEAVIQLICTGLQGDFQEIDVISKWTAVVTWSAGSVAGISLAIVLAATLNVRSTALAQMNPTKGLAVIPPDKDTDLIFYQADGTIQNGAEALRSMASDADLVL